MSFLIFNNPAATLDDLPWTDCFWIGTAFPIVAGSIRHSSNMIRVGKSQTEWRRPHPRTRRCREFREQPWQMLVFCWLDYMEPLVWRRKQPSPSHMIKSPEIPVEIRSFYKAFFLRLSVKQMEATCLSQKTFGPPASTTFVNITLCWGNCGIPLVFEITNNWMTNNRRHTVIDIRSELNGLVSL